MQSEDNVFTGWHSTDDETPVPVRSSSARAPVVEEVVQGTTHDIAAADLGHITIQRQTTETTKHGMTFSAILGVTLALGGIGMYLGIGNVNLRGDLLGGETATVIQISESGEFTPSSATIRPGETVTIENKNTDPQVLKPRGDRDLFPVQVVFDEPFTFTVPADAQGQYIYYSETLPSDKTVTFNVATDSQTNGAGQTMSSSSAPQDTISIPLPFGGGSVDLPTSEFPSSVPASSVASVDASTTHSGDTATIELGGTSSSTSSVASGTSNIPTNPYTVANAPKNTGSQIASSASSKTLHSGAPLLAKNIRKPVRTSDTGPGGMVFLFVPALLGVVALSRKLNLA